MNKLPIVAALAGFLSVGSAQAIVIDDFSVGNYNKNAPQTNDSAGNSSGGYARTVDISTSGDFTNVQLNTTTNPGVYAHSQSSGVTGFSSVSFDLGGIDLTSDSNAFRVTVVNADLDGTFGITVGGQSQSLVTDVSFLIATGGYPAVVDFLFSDFAGVDFSNVSTVELFSNGNNQAALDMVLDNFGTVCTDAASTGPAGNISSTLCVNSPPPPAPGVPEPGVLALLGLGLMGTMGLRRRKQA